MESTKGQIRTLTWRRICYGGNGGENSIDGGGDQWQEVTGDDPETKGAAELGGAVECFEEISKISTRCIYT
jgi:hypothetical protein